MTSFLGVDPAIVALGLLLLLFIAFTIEKYPPEVTAAGGAALFIVLGLTPTDEGMSVFSSSAPITIAAMFVVSGALVRTGVLDSLAGLVIGRAQTRPVLAVLIFVFATIVASAFMNNTPVVLVLIPVVILIGFLVLRAVYNHWRKDHRTPTTAPTLSARCRFQEGCSPLTKG